MGKLSREKGKRGERLFVSLCKENGFYGVRRSVQYCGKTGDAADFTGLPGIHVECKFVERLNVREAMEQATHDATSGTLATNCKMLRESISKND